MGGGLHIKRHRRSIDFGKEAASKKRKTESLQRTHILTINRVSNNKKLKSLDQLQQEDKAIPEPL